MKRLFAIALIIAPVFFAGFLGAGAAGVCAGHSGINCLAGPALYGYTQCNDNTTSSVLYSQTGECISDTASGCISPRSAGCTDSLQMSALQQELDKNVRACELLLNPSVQYYAGCRFPSIQRQIEICGQQIRDYQLDQQNYGSCIKNYYQFILNNVSTTLALQLKEEQKACALKSGYAWDKGNKKCVNANPAAAIVPVQQAYDVKKNLGLGATGGDVAVLQKFLQDKNFLKMPAGTATGYFGILTRNAVIEFQKSAGLPATGYCGLLTRAAINSSK